MESFIEIGLSVWAVEVTHTYRHTHRQTDRHTHTLGWIATYSVKMTEYKKRPIQIFLKCLVVQPYLVGYPMYRRGTVVDTLACTPLRNTKEISLFFVSDTPFTLG